MKIITDIKSDVRPKWVILLLQLLCLYQLAATQPMHGHIMPASKQNIFLLMMDTMMMKMPVDRKEGSSVEAAFISQMIPHHEGAIEMAKYEIATGKAFAMIQLAKSIVAEQRMEIQQMERLAKKASPVSGKNGAGFWQASEQAMKVMMQHLPDAAALNNTDVAFARVMIPHHQAAIDMAKALINYTKDPSMLMFANHIITSQQTEIAQMNLFLNK